MTHQDNDLSTDTHFILSLILNQKLAEFRKKAQQEIHKMKITLDANLSAYIYVDWMKRGSGGIIWGHRLMIEVPFLYEELGTDPEFKLESVDVLLEVLKEHYPFLQERNILLFDTGWAKRDEQAVLVSQTQINFSRELFLRLKELSHEPCPVVDLYLERDGSLRPKRDSEDTHDSDPLHFSVSSEQWGLIKRMKWRRGLDDFPPDYYSRLKWFFQMVDQIEQAFIHGHNLHISAGLTYEVELQVI